MEKISQKDSARFMASLLSNFVNNLCEIIHRINCKYGRNDKKCEFCRIKYIYCGCFLQKKNFKDDLIEYKCLDCNKTYKQKFDEKLKVRFFYIYKFSYRDNDKCVLLLQEGVYPFEYMNDWEKCNEATLPERESFYSHLNMEDIADKDHVYAKTVCKEFRRSS